MSAIELESMRTARPNIRPDTNRERCKAVNDYIGRSVEERVGGNGQIGEAIGRGKARIRAWFATFDGRRFQREEKIRAEERLKERERVARELHDTLLQGFFCASAQLHTAVDQMPPATPNHAAFSSVLRLMDRMIEQCRNSIRGLRSCDGPPPDLEQALARVPDEFAARDGAGFRVIVVGRPKQLKPAVHDEIYHIGREALLNALRHSKATDIEVNAEYSNSSLRLVVRDNGRGIDPQVMRRGSGPHWGMLGMKERARVIGARLQVWSRPGAGTEVAVSIPGSVAFEAVGQ